MQESVLKVENLRKWFPVKVGFWQSVFTRKQLFVRAVDGVSFYIKKREIFGLAGESGSGKTTIGKLILRLIEPTDGKIYFKQKNITAFSESQLKPLRREMQMIFQDPYQSLNPRMTISSILAEPLQVQGLGNRTEIKEEVAKVLTDVELFPPEEFIYRYPHELSGGQRQRIAVARAFILNPTFVVADEPVSMLDISIRAEILDLMLLMVKKFDASFLYITHDLAIARHMCDRIAIMYLGKIMEIGSTEKIVNEPLHPYTKALISAVPVPDPTSERVEVVIKGEIPSPINVPPGCRFHTRCPFVMDICREKEPKLTEVENERFAACHLLSSSLLKR